VKKPDGVLQKAVDVLVSLKPALRLAAVAMALAVVSVSAQAPLDVRVALIIGNSAYAGAPLVNPVNDARAMSEVLRSLGFQVIELRDGSRAQMTAAIFKASETLKGKQGVGMLYYAGHGLQLDWHNYMVPIDALLKSAADVERQAVDLGGVIDLFKGAGNRMNIVVLDACRDNPFAGGTSSAKGLAPLDAPPSTFLAYSTAPGNVAEDGDAASGNGLYTQYLLQELKRPTARIEDVFKRVRLNVRKQSQGRQIPWESTSLEDDFFFNDGVRHTIKPEELERMAAAARERELQRLAQETLARERELQLVLQVTRERERQQAETMALEQQRAAAQARAREAERLGAEARARAQEQFITEAKTLEQQRLTQEAVAREREQALALAQSKERERLLAEAQTRERERLAEATRLEALANVQPPDKKLSKEQLAEMAFEEQKTAWDRIRASTTPDDFYAFLERYPSGGELSEMAQYRLDQLAKPKILATLGKGQDASLAYVGPRFKVGDVFRLQVSDTLTSVVSGERVVLVTAIDGDIVQLNGGNGTLTTLGARIKNRRGSFDPPFGGLPVEFQVGKSWSGRSTLHIDDSDNARDNQGKPRGSGGRGSQSRQNGQDDQGQQAQHSSKIVARETVVVPAGTFQTYLVESTIYFSNGKTVRRKSWVDPRYGYPVKFEEILRNARGTIVSGDREELVAIKAERN
jgi:uncharacterized caspase-like protein